jgi:hypothetical protein
VVAEGTAARVDAPHLRWPEGRASGAAPRAGDLLAALAAPAAARLPAAERPYLELVARRLEGGSLSERIRRRLAPAAPRGRAARIREIYEELALCLARNEVWQG